jgi:spermidine synthase
LTRFGEPIAADGSFANVFEGEVLYSGRSEFQKIDVYDNAFFGRVLTLDDLVQTTERDEFFYHEMLVHPALASLERVDRVLIIGGGDGGTLRHVLMHGASDVVMCEIDEEVVRVCRELMPALSDGAFDDPRGRVVFADGAAFVAEHENVFDAVIVDGSDAVGPATVLFSEAFYGACRRALVPGGVFAAQTGSPIFQSDEFDLALGNLRRAFPTVEPYVANVPTYPGVLWSYMSATDGSPVSSADPVDVSRRLRERGITPRYYTPELHRGAFALPAFVETMCETAEPASVPRG